MLPRVTAPRVLYDATPTSRRGKCGFETPAVVAFYFSNAGLFDE
jgi:hypothetical protein